MSQEPVITLNETLYNDVPPTDPIFYPLYSEPAEKINAAVEQCIDVFPGGSFCTQYQFDAYVAQFNPNSSIFYSPDIVTNALQLISDQVDHSDAICKDSGNSTTKSHRTCKDFYTTMSRIAPDIGQDIITIIINYNNILSAFYRAEIGLGCYYCQNPAYFTGKTIPVDKNYISNLKSNVSSATENIATAIYDIASIFSRVPTQYLDYFPVYYPQYSHFLTKIESYQTSDVAAITAELRANQLYYNEITYSYALNSLMWVNWWGQYYTPYLDYPDLYYYSPEYDSLYFYENDSGSELPDNSEWSASPQDDKLVYDGYDEQSQFDQSEVYSYEVEESQIRAEEHEVSVEEDDSGSDEWSDDSGGGSGGGSGSAVMPTHSTIDEIYEKKLLKHLEQQKNSSEPIDFDDSFALIPFIDETADGLGSAKPSEDASSSGPLYNIVSATKVPHELTLALTNLTYDPFYNNSAYYRQGFNDTPVLYVAAPINPHDIFPSTGDQLSTGGKIAIGILIPLLFFIIVGISWLCCCKRHRKTKGTSSQNQYMDGTTPAVETMTFV